MNYLIDYEVLRYDVAYITPSGKHIPGETFRDEKKAVEHVLKYKKDHPEVQPYIIKLERSSMICPVTIETGEPAADTLPAHIAYWDDETGVTINYTDNRDGYVIKIGDMPGTSVEVYNSVRKAWDDLNRNAETAIKSVYTDFNEAFNAAKRLEQHWADHYNV